MITLYQEWKAHQGEVAWRSVIPYSDKINFRDYALNEESINYQSRCLGSRRLGDFDLVGVAECQDAFIAQLRNKDWTGFVENNTREITLDKPRYKNLGITEEFLEEFESWNELDYLIYQQAREFMGYC